MYSVLAAIHNTGTHINRPNQYDEFIVSYDFSDVLGEVSIEQIDLFERKIPSLLMSTPMNIQRKSR